MVLAFIMYPRKPAMGKHQEPFLLHELDLCAIQVHHCIFMVQSKCCNLTELAQNCCAQQESYVELLWVLVHWHACIGIPAQAQDPLRSPSNWLQSDYFFSWKMLQQGHGPGPLNISLSAAAGSEATPHCC